jgi:hypothetical protein
VLKERCGEYAQNMMEEGMAECVVNGLKEGERSVLRMQGICPESIKGGKVESVFLLLEFVV